MIQEIAITMIRYKYSVDCKFKKGIRIPNLFKIIGCDILINPQHKIYPKKQPNKLIITDSEINKKTLDL